MSTPRILLAVTGASGAIYARRTLQRLLEHEEAVGITLSVQGEAIARTELGDAPDPVALILGQPDSRVVFYPRDDFSGPFATGSQAWQAVIVAPCSMGTAGRISAGVSHDLITRAADVALKERRRLILVPRETPFSLLHLRNLTALAEAGAVILPPSPGFYQGPQTINDLVDFVVDRILTQVYPT
jgi:4-hydroxy-3-polyprenylbenzoate decarboxylase